MRMNQQHHQRANGFSARQKHNENNAGQQRQIYRHQTSVPKQEFKPVAILKRGEPTGTPTVSNKDDHQAKENISANGQQTTKPRNYRVAVAQQAQPTPSIPIILSATKAPVDASSPASSPSIPVPTTPVPSAVPTTPSINNNPPSLAFPPVIHRPTGPINLIRSNSSIPTPLLTPTQHDQHNHSIHSRLFSSSMTMKTSLKLIDDSLTWCENGQLNNYLQDSDGFVVIGAIGREKVGKSTLLSLLGGNQFIDEDRSMIFPAAPSNSSEITRGIDVYVTNEQTILLDTQPLLSSQLHQQQTQQFSTDHHRSQQTAHYWQQQTDPRSMFIDNILELQTLEIIAFILAVCHVVLIVEDQFADPYLYRLLHLAEILRPILKRNSNEVIRTHSPHLVFILNKCNNYISPQERLLIKRSLVQMMMDTHFRIYSSLKKTDKIQIQTNVKTIVADWKQQELNENFLIKLLEQVQTEKVKHSLNYSSIGNDHSRRLIYRRMPMKIWRKNVSGIFRSDQY